MLLQYTLSFNQLPDEMLFSVSSSCILIQELSQELEFVLPVSMSWFYKGIHLD